MPLSSLLFRRRTNPAPSALPPTTTHSDPFPPVGLKSLTADTLPNNNNNNNNSSPHCINRNLHPSPSCSFLSSRSSSSPSSFCFSSSSSPSSMRSDLAEQMDAMALSKDDDDDDDFDEDDNDDEEGEGEEEEEEKERGCWGYYGRRDVPRWFPPPIPVLAKLEESPRHMPRLLKRTYEDDGRLVIREVKVHHHEFLRASRENGRLILKLIHLDDVCGSSAPPLTSVLTMGVHEQGEEEEVQEEEDAAEEELAPNMTPTDAGPTASPEPSSPFFFEEEKNSDCTNVVGEDGPRGEPAVGAGGGGQLWPTKGRLAVPMTVLSSSMPEGMGKGCLGSRTMLKMAMPRVHLVRT